MATHSSILAWRIPTDRGAWWATVHGVIELDPAEQLTLTHTHTHTHTLVGLGWHGPEARMSREGARRQKGQEWCWEQEDRGLCAAS